MFINRNPKGNKIWAGFMIEKVSIAEAEARGIPPHGETDGETEEKSDQEYVEEAHFEEAHVYLFFGSRVQNTWENKLPILLFLVFFYIPILICLVGFFKD